MRLTFLNAPSTDKEPSLWLDIVQKGIKLKFRVAHSEFLGVPQPAAALVGSALGFVFFGLVVWLIETVWVAALLCLVYGILLLTPGALSIKLWRWSRDLLGG